MGFVTCKIKMSHNNNNTKSRCGKQKCDIERLIHYMTSEIILLSSKYDNLKMHTINPKATTIKEL